MRTAGIHMDLVAHIVAVADARQAEPSKQPDPVPLKYRLSEPIDGKADTLSSPLI